MAAASLALLGLAACSSGQQHETAPPAIGDIAAVDDVGRLLYPLGAYELTPEQAVKLQKAQDLLGQQCMRRFGFDWRTPERVPDAHDDRRYGVVDLKSVARWGYHPPREPSTARAVGLGPTPSPAAVGVYLGRGPSIHNGLLVPEGGCREEARRALGDTSQNDRLPLTDELGRLAGRQTEADYRLRDGFNRWNRCMKQSGHEYRNPWSANDDPNWGTPAPTRHEIATAIADVRCKEETKLVALWFAVESAYQKRLIKQHAEALAMIKRQHEEQLRRAASHLRRHQWASAAPGR